MTRQPFTAPLLAYTGYEIAYINMQGEGGMMQSVIHANVCTVFHLLANGNENK
jgi:hypothetical protein